MSTKTETIQEVSNGQETLELSGQAELVKTLKSLDTLPLWAQMEKLNPPLPNPQCVPHIWRYDEIRPSLLRAGDVVSEAQAERRVLMLVNPARGEGILTNEVCLCG